MKKQFVLFFAVLLFAGSLFSQRKAGATFVGSYNYGVQLNCSNISVTSASIKWYRNICEDKNLFVLLESIKRALISGKLKARANNWDPKDTAILSVPEITSKFFIEQQYESYDEMENFVKVIKEEIFFDNNIYLTFYEDWYYNADENELTKEVTAIGLGKYIEIKEVGQQLARVPLNVPGKFHADVSVTDLSFDVRTWGEPEDDAYFRVLNNKLLFKAKTDHSLLRSCKFSFAEKISEAAFTSTCDTISKCYDFGFSEDWAYDSVNFSLRKTVKNIQFNYRKNSDFPLKPQANFIFKGFKEYKAEKNAHSFNCVETSQTLFSRLNDGFSTNDSLVMAGATKLFKKLDAKITSGELPAFMPAECENMGKIMFSLLEYKSRITIEYGGVEYDSLGNFVTERTFIDTLRATEGLRMNQSVQLDLGANKIKREVKMITPLLFLEDKEAFKPLFSVPVKSDSGYVPVPADLICKNAKQRIIFQRDNLLFESNAQDMHMQGFSIYNNAIPFKERYELLTSVYSLAQSGTVKLFKPGTDSVLSLKEINAINDSLTIRSLGKGETPNWFLSISEMQTVEDWYYNEKTNTFKIVTKEIIFCRKRPTGFTEKVFSLKYAQ